MPKVEINGRIVEFEKMPTEQDIDEVATKLGISKASQEPAEPEGVRGVQGFGVGLVKSGLGTLRGMGELGTKILNRTTGLVGLPAGGTDLYKPETALGQRAVQATTARGGAEKFGKFTGDLAQFVAPTSKLLALEKGVGLAGRMAIEGVSSGAIMAAQTGKVGKEAGITAGIAALIPGAGAAYRALRPSTLVEKSANKIIDEAVNKGLRPSVVGKRTSSQAQGYYTKAREAVKTILQNKQTLNIVDMDGKGKALPTSLNEFGQAIESTKKIIFQQYDDLAKRAGKKGAEVDLAPIAKNLDEIINSKSLSIANPQAVKYANDLRNRLLDVDAVMLPGGGGVMRGQSKLDAQTTQDVIKHYNSALEAFYKNPTYDNASKAAIDAMIVNNLRKSLDDVIENTSAPGYQALKNQYGALKTIENDVIRRAVVDARKNVKGLLDFTDIFSGGQVVSGIISMNPALIAQGVVQKTLTSTFKRLNDPNRIVQKMFEQVDNLYSKPVSENFGRAFKEGAKQQSIFRKTNELTEKISKFNIEGLRNYDDLAKKAKGYFGKDFNSPTIQNWLKTTKQLFQQNRRTGVPARIFGSDRF